MCAIFFLTYADYLISEKLSPEEVVEFLNEYMTLMVNCIDLTFGIVDKFIGDAIMATGEQWILGNPAENAINAALMDARFFDSIQSESGAVKKNQSLKLDLV